MKGMTNDEKMLFLTEYSSEKKDVTVGVLLALFFGGFGAHKFYFGQNGTPGLDTLLNSEFDQNTSRTIMELTNESGKKINIRIGRYGVYLQDEETNTTLPDEIIPSEINFDDAQDSLNKKAEGPKEICVHPETNDPVYLKDGRFGPYIQSGKKMKSLLPGMQPEEVTEKIALDIISLPKEVGKHPESEEIIKSDIGRYGPYLRCGKISRSISAPDNILELTEKRAIELILSAPEKSGPRVIKDLGEDPKTKLNIEIKKSKLKRNLRKGIF